MTTTHDCVVCTAGRQHPRPSKPTVWPVIMTGRIVNGRKVGLRPHKIAKL